MAQTVDLWGATYSNVPAIDVPSGNSTARFTDVTPTTATDADVASGKIYFKSDGSQSTGTASGGGTPAISIVDTTDSAGGTIRTITALNISDTTATASDVASGKYFYTATGIKTAGTGGGTPSATQHTIYFEFDDSTNTTLYAWYDETFVSDAITATTPTTYGGKTVTLAQLDGVTWYDVADIPMNTELIDFSKVKNNYIINASGAEIEYQYASVSDYTRIESTMTFTYKAYQWFYIGFYDSSKTPISTIYVDNDKTSATSEIATGTLTPAKIPLNAKYVRIDSLANPTSSHMSLIRTA